MRRTRLAMTALFLLGAPTPAMAQAGGDCPAPETAARYLQTARDGTAAYRPPGSEICIRRPDAACFGCEAGFVHRCAGGVWRPLAERPCGDETDRTASLDAGGSTGVAGSDDGRTAWPGSVDRPRTGPSGTVPFRHCRYFDADGTEIRVPAEEASRARDLGLVAWQRCETVFCRLYGEDGRPLYYAPDDQDLVREDIRKGHVSVRASECRPATRTTALPDDRRR